MNGKVGMPEQVWIAQAVQYLEAQGPLNDNAVLRDVLASTAEREQRLLARAWRLGEALGLDRQLQHLRELASGMVWLLVAVVLVSAYGVARATVGGGSTLNVAAVWVCLLGLHVVTLLIWCLGWVLPWPAAGAWLGRLWLVLVTRVPWGRGNVSPSNAGAMAQAGRELLQRERLLPWLMGLVSHGVWALSFVVVLAVLGFAFSFQAFRLTWESTILEPQFFVDFVQTTGWLPSLLGVPIPDASSVANPDTARTDQRAWALWLMGCVLVYGLVPRALLALWCWGVWRKRKKQLRLDTADPYFRKILARFDALQPVVVLDEEHAWTGANTGALPSSTMDAAARAVVGFELPPEVVWPVLTLPENTPNPVWQHSLSGTSEERQAVLAVLRQRHPGKLLLVCHGASSPDRGTERFVRACAAEVGACCILLVVAPGVPLQASRWADWLARSGLPLDSGGGLLADVVAAEHWLADSLVPIAAGAPHA